MKEPLKGSIVTQRQLAEGVRALGVRQGMDVIAHVSLSKFGWVCGGAVAVIQALQEVLSPAGTLMMPAHSSIHSEPSRWAHPPVPEPWWPIIRAEMPPFEPRTTPTLGIGRVPEAFRSFPGVHRSAHPACSFCAWGRRAVEFTAEHRLDRPFGDGSPLANLCDAGGQVLLLGVGYDACTMLHLAEERTPGFPQHEEGAAILDDDGERRWATYRAAVYDADLFEEIGAAFESAYEIRRGQIGDADCRLVDAGALVEIGVRFLSRTVLG